VEAVIQSFCPHSGLTELSYAAAHPKSVPNLLQTLIILNVKHSFVKAVAELIEAVCTLSTVEASSPPGQEKASYSSLGLRTGELVSDKWQELTRSKPATYRNRPSAARSQSRRPAAPLRCQHEGQAVQGRPPINETIHVGRVPCLLNHLRKYLSETR